RAAHGVMCSFLGANALADRAPATLAWRANATSLVVGSANGKIELLDVLTPRLNKDAVVVASKEWIDAATRQATERLEELIRREPASWLWLHRRWRAPLVRKSAASTSADEAASRDLAAVR